jgi:glycosyltransferase involved in cell wall biosynthesis
VCGKGPDLPRLRELARLEGVTLRELGFVKAPELAALMADSHLMMQPSLTTPEWSEQFGRSVAEAMTVGLPCLVSDSGELPNVVGRDPRAVFHEGDVDDMRRHLQSATQDDVALEGLSKDQRLLAHRWQPDVAAAAMLAFWGDCLS